MEKITGFLAPVLVYICIFILNAALPGRWITGYVKDEKTGEKLRYRLNGLLVLISVVLTWMLLCHYGFMAWDWLYEYRWYGLAGAAVFGLIFSFSIVVPFPAVRKTFLADIYLGRLENPRLWNGRIDAKMWLYLSGAIMLELNILSFTAHHIILYGDQASPGVYCAAALLSFFVIDYLFFEEVHLYTYDFVAERAGFKLGWGCLAFYPYFYAVPLWAVIGLPGKQPDNYIFLLYAGIFATGWILSRGANLQKFYFKKDPERKFMGMAPKAITDGNRSILVSGFWGMSRHINYLGEVIMATGIVLSTGYHSLFWPWLYPVYYILLLGTRQMYDHKRCALKYGKLWDEYTKKVPYRIIPFVY